MRSSNFSTTYGTTRLRRTALLVRVRRSATNPRRGWLLLDGRAIPVALGRAGIKANKWEGDGATPRGCFKPRAVWWRADRHRRPLTLLPTRIIRHADAWCEDPSSRLYNRPIRLADGKANDRLARHDHLYDFIVEIDHNVRPRVRQRGSAVFLHLARPGFAPTSGCVAMTLASMRHLLARLGPATVIEIR
jgi:L,D-peptidoglycan transpeptidase YkuD (ErfK/YbiS/YcfS/YnhG family)